MRKDPSSLLRRLERLKTDYDRRSADGKLELLRGLERRRLDGAEEIHRLHEAVCFLRAFPDDPRILDATERILAAFAERGDLRRHRAELTDTGIAGTPINYRFYWVTARWLARRWPHRLSVDWPELDSRDRLTDTLDLLVPWSETTALDLLELSAEEWIERLKGPDETDAVFLIRRFERLDAGAAVRERIYEQLDVPMTLAPGPAAPSRTLARLPGAPVVFQKGPLERRRPDLRSEIGRRPRSIRPLDARDGRAMIELARESMVTRSRDLDAFAYANPRDVRILTFDRGLQFIAFGLEPSRRLLLEASYGFLTIRNGVPIGYALTRSLFGSTEVAYNIFETFRGAEAAPVFARLLAMFRRLFGGDTFAIDPYQLGHGNEEGLASGAWWFYYKLGFRPRNPEVRRVLRSELDRMKADPEHRSSISTLERLSADYVFLHLGRRRTDVLGLVSLADISLRISEGMARRFGADREAAVRTCSAEAAELLGLESLPRWSRSERQAWERWAPLVLILPGVDSWSSSDKARLARVVRAKGGPREDGFVRLFDRHAPLREALLRLARR